MGYIKKGDLIKIIIHNFTPFMGKLKVEWHMNIANLFISYAILLLIQFIILSKLFKQ